MNIIFASRKGKKNTFKREPRAKECLVDDSDSAALRRLFRFRTGDRRIYNSKISKLVEFSKSLGKRSQTNGVLGTRFDRVLAKLSSYDKGQNSMALVADIVANPNFDPNMVNHLCTISGGDKIAKSLELFNRMMSNSRFRGRMLDIGLSVILHQTIHNPEKTFDKIWSIVNGNNFSDKLVPVLVNIVRNSGGQELYWNLYVLDKIVKNERFCHESINYLIGLTFMPDPDLQWKLEILNGTISNRRFNASVLSNQLVSDISTISRAISETVDRTRFSEQFLILRRRLSNSENIRGEVAAIKCKVEMMRSEQEVVSFFNSLKSPVFARQK